jgi:eukaryotic-like serine/threonine-protein kinase
VAVLVALLIAAGLIFGFKYISGSGGNIAVPQVNGLTLKAAETDIANAHLISAVKTKASSSTPKGHVITTSPPNGKFVPKNSTVTLFVSTGPGKVTVPDVRGKSVSAAANTLTAMNLQVREVSVSSTAPSNEVVRESPPAGSLVNPGTSITLYYSSGGITVPNVVGQPAATAEQILSQAGFKVVPHTLAGGPGSTPGNVFSQNPSGGTAPSGSTVTIYIAAQPTPSPTPTATTPSPPPSTSSPSPSGSPST